MLYQDSTQLVHDMTYLRRSAGGFGERLAELLNHPADLAVPGLAADAVQPLRDRQPRGSEEHPG